MNDSENAGQMSRIAELEAENDRLKQRMQKLEQALIDQNPRQEPTQYQDERQRIPVEMLSDYVYELRIEPDGTLIPECTIDSLARMLGFQTAQLDVAVNPTAICHPANISPVESQLQQLRAGHEAAGYVRIMTPDGDVRRIRAFARPIWNADEGRTTHIYGIAQDMTELHQAEAALQEQQSLLQALLDHSPVGIFVRDLQGHILLVNKYTATAYGLTPEQMIGKHAGELFSPDQIDQWREEDERTLAAGAALDYTDHVLLDDGWHTYLVVKFPLFNAQGKVYAIGGVATDITKLKRAESALQDLNATTSHEAQAAYQTRVEHSLQALIIIQDDRIVFANPAATDITGYTEQELCALAIADMINLMPPEGREQIVAEIDRFMHSDDPHLTLEIRVVCKDGLQRWIETMIAPISYRGKPAFQIAYIDITERKKAAEKLGRLTEQLREANAELAQALRTKDEFLATMSHELRTPLNVMLGLSEALLEGVYGPVAIPHQAAITSIHESGQRLLSLISDILDLTQINAGRIELSMGRVDVSATCLACLRYIMADVRKKQFVLVTNFDPDVTTIAADERRLKQIIMNLLSNAVKFTPTGGEISLETMGDREHGTMRLIVKDTGIGIAPEKQRRIFRPFVQLDSSLHRHFEGAGLGLALVTRLVDLHGGHISVESEVGVGSRFIVTLPWNPELDDERNTARWTVDTQTKTSVTPMARRDASDESPLILIAEDNDSTSAVIARYLQRHGYRFAIARDGADAIQQARSAPPALILMDIQMPGMNGLEATRQIRADAALASIPIIALTALVMPGDRERGLEAGAQDYLSKPVSLKRITSLIEQYLQKGDANRAGK